MATHSPCCQQELLAIHFIYRGFTWLHWHQYITWQNNGGDNKHYNTPYAICTWPEPSFMQHTEKQCFKFRSYKNSNSIYTFCERVVTSETEQIVAFNRKKFTHYTGHILQGNKINHARACRKNRTNCVTSRQLFPIYSLPNFSPLTSLNSSTYLWFPDFSWT